MKEFLSKLFFPAPDDENLPPRDGLQQGQREALIDLLLLAMYSDNHLSLSEKAVLTDQVEAFDWRSGTTPDLYIEEATARVREADGKDVSRGALIKDIAQRLETEDACEFGLSLTKRLFQADADVDIEEISFLQNLRRTLLA